MSNSLDPEFQDLADKIKADPTCIDLFQRFDDLELEEQYASYRKYFMKLLIWMSILEQEENVENDELIALLNEEREEIFGKLKEFHNTY